MWSRADEDAVTARRMCPVSHDGAHVVLVAHMHEAADTQPISDEQVAKQRSGLLIASTREFGDRRADRPRRSLVSNPRYRDRGPVDWHVVRSVRAGNLYFIEDSAARLRILQPRDNGVSAASMHPARQQRGQVSRASKVGIAVEADVETILCDGRVNGVKYLDCPTGVLQVIHVAMREVQGNVRTFRDAQTVLITLDHRATVIAMMRAVVPAGITHRLAERNDFVVIGVHAWRVRESGRQARGAVGKTLRDYRDHALELVDGRRSLLGS